uniref:(northern house mosquito) hypothetical protein n=1 Tax=Culex pipiens TaxID=7175 RepID=A0A8D8G7T4_CULPI
MAIEWRNTVQRRQLQVLRGGSLGTSQSLLRDQTQRENRDRGSNRRWQIIHHWIPLPDGTDRGEHHDRRGGYGRTDTGNAAIEHFDHSPRSGAVQWNVAQEFGPLRPVLGRGAVALVGVGRAEGHCRAAGSAVARRRRRFQL